MDADKKSVNIEPEKKKSKVSMLFSNRSLTRSLGSLRSVSTTSRMRTRKQSYGFSGVAGIRNAEKQYQHGAEYKRPILTYLNTYQLDPSVRFNPAQVLKAADAVLDELFTEKHKYNVQDSPTLALQISSMLLRSVKLLGFNRYRIISVVTIAQKRAQSYANAVAFLWDHERDNYVDTQREEHTCFIHVTVFGIYLD